MRTRTGAEVFGELVMMGAKLDASRMGMWLVGAVGKVGRVI
jgi:hypothetical protein